MTVMVPYFRKVCAIFGCDFIPGVEKHYYSFPKDVTLRNIWVHACRRSDTVNPETAAICGRHFSASQLKQSLKFKLLNIHPPKNYRHLLPTAVPDINLPRSSYTLASNSVAKAFDPQNGYQTLGGKCQII